MSNGTLDPIARRVRIRIAALGHPSMSEWHRTYLESGGGRSYAWWRGLSTQSPVSAIEEAAGALGVSAGALLGVAENTAESLMRGMGPGRVKLNEA